MNAEETQERQLLQRAIAGDSKAIELLFEAHHAGLSAYIKRRLPAEVNRTIEVTDVLQDTFYEACYRFDTFEDRGGNTVYRWLLTIARSRMVDLLRMHRSRPRFSSASLSSSTDDAIASALEELAVYRRTPSRSAQSHEFLAAVELSLEKLPVDFRRAVVYRHIDGLSVAETAERMGRTSESVHVLCCRGLRLLRAELVSRSYFV